MNITVVTPKRKSHFRIYEKIPESVSVERFSFLDISGFRFPSTGWGIYRFLISKLKSYDLIHSQNNMAFLVSSKRIPKIETIHEVIKDDIEATRNVKIKSFKDKLYSSFYYKFHLYVEQKNLETVDHFITVSKFTKESLINKYGLGSSSITVIPNGVNLDKFRARSKQGARELLGLPLDKRILLAIGRLEQKKNIGILVSIIDLLKRENIVLVVCGLGGELNILKRLTIQKGLSKNIMFVGFVDDRLLPFYYNAADLCVHTSVVEGFGLVLAESMASGTPVVALATGASKEVTNEGRCAILVERPIPDQFAAAINRVLSNEDLYRRLKKIGMSHVRENYSWEHAGKKTLEVYEKVR